MGYSKRTVNYLERIALYNMTDMMSMAELVAINVKTLRINMGAFYRKISFIWSI